jgi:hypothetical protein
VEHLQHDLAKRMRGFGRQCRGMGKVFVTLVRQTETHLLALGQPVLALAQAAEACLQGATHLAEEQRARLGTQLRATLEAHRRIAHQSRRLTQGQALPSGKLVNADAPLSHPLVRAQATVPPSLAASLG